MPDNVIEDIPVTMEELRRKRITGAAQSILAMLLDPPTSQEDRTVFQLRMRVELSEEERAELLDAMLGSFPPDLAETHVQAHFEGAGYPKPTLMKDAEGDAQFWASHANAAEIRAYAKACVSRMSDKTITAFRKWLANR